MTIFNLTKKTEASTGQKITLLGGGDVNTNIEISNLENKINDQEKKLNKIIELLQNGNNIPNTNK